MDSTKLPLRTWFLAIFLISRDKTGLSWLALIRHLGTSDRTARLIQHQLMAAMAQRETEQPPEGCVQLDDACLVGERPGSTGRGSENRVPFVAAVACNQADHSLRIKVSPVRAFDDAGKANQPVAEHIAGGQQVDLDQRRYCLSGKSVSNRCVADRRCGPAISCNGRDRGGPHFLALAAP